MTLPSGSIIAGKVLFNGRSDSVRRTGKDHKEIEVTEAQVSRYGSSRLPRDTTRPVGERHVCNLFDYQPGRVLIATVDLYWGPIYLLQ
jgi:hypothetical protein